MNFSAVVIILREKDIVWYKVSSSRRLLLLCLPADCPLYNIILAFNICSTDVWPNVESVETSLNVYHTVNFVSLTAVTFIETDQYLTLLFRQLVYCLIKKKHACSHPKSHHTL